MIYDKMDKIIPKQRRCFIGKQSRTIGLADVSSSRTDQRCSTSCWAL
jgi:hypothetical protein